MQRAFFVGSFACAVGATFALVSACSSSSGNGSPAPSSLDAEAHDAGQPETSTSNDAGVIDAGSDVEVDAADADTDSEFNGDSTCSGLLAANTWDSTLGADAFAFQAAWDAYTAMNNCACVNTQADDPAGCAAICDMNQSGSPTPNFCNGTAPLVSCNLCLQNSCQAALDACGAN